MERFKNLAITALLAAAALIAAPAQADLILTGDDATYTSADFCNTNSNSELLSCLVEEIDLGTEQYKSEVPSGEEGDLAGSYAVTYSNENHDFELVYTGGDTASGDPLWLLVKDGKHDPAWYLFDLSALGWNGMETIIGTCLWGSIDDAGACTTTSGSISHISIFSETTTVPEPGTLMLFGGALLGLAMRRRRQITA